MKRSMARHWKETRGASSEDKAKAMDLASEIEKLAQELMDKTEELRSELKAEGGTNDGTA